MAYERTQFTFPAKAGADLSGLQYYLVKMSGDDTVNITATANEACAGILQNKPAASGRHAEVCFLGVSKVRVDGACSYGDRLSVADSGFATVADSGLGTIGLVVHGCASGMIATAAINCANAVSELA